ncbi:flagellar protein FlaG [Bordetella trematum]|uniref:flagellar protein FlaG n=1 Tax=Bordetella trematum TaxID=123899 RepID=UPI000D850D59|nr:flagellar protein FlaG [Bordetella trematum]SPU50713.1 flagellar protein [Bordetella trematum]VDH06960.1 flagellar protein FlaG [Bordetella trematum]
MEVSPISPALHVASAPAAPALPPDPAALATPAAAGTSSQGSHNNASPAPRSGDQPASSEAALDEINKQLRAWSTELQFEMDPELQKIVVSVRDAESGEVLRTIPSDAVIRIAKMIVSMQGNAVSTSV